jgi:hypothetical protein
VFGRRHRPARLHPELMAEALRLLASDSLADRLQAAQLLARAYALDEEARLAEGGAPGAPVDDEDDSSCTPSKNGVDRH